MPARLAKTPPLLKMNWLKLSKILALVGAFTLTLTIYLITSGIEGSGDPRYSWARMIDGSADKPFVYRTLAPTIARLAVAAGLPMLTVVIWLAALGLLAWLVLMRRLALALDITFNPLWALLGLLPIMVRVSHLYDVWTLTLTTALLYCIQAGRLNLYRILFVLACLNRESAVLFIPLYIWQVGLNREAAYQVIVWVAVQMLVRWTYAANPGATFELHLPHHWPEIRLHPDLAFTYGALIVITLRAVFTNWRSKPVLLKRALTLWLPVLIVGYGLIGYPFEFRFFYEAWPAVWLLTNDRNLSTLQSLRFSPAA